MKPEIEDEYEDWRCDDVCKLDSTNPENKQLIWSRELKKDRYRESLVDCKNETSKGVWTDSDYWENKNGEISVCWIKYSKLRRLNYWECSFPSGAS